MSASADWGLQNASIQSQPDGSRVIAFKFDTRGGRLFGDLTKRWSEFAKSKSSGPFDDVHVRLAIVLDGKVISAPTILNPILGGAGIISGGGEGGFTTEESKYLAAILNAGSLPFKLSDAPINERIIGPAGATTTSQPATSK